MDEKIYELERKLDALEDRIDALTATVDEQATVIEVQATLIEDQAKKLNANDHFNLSVTRDLEKLTGEKPVKPGQKMSWE